MKIVQIESHPIPSLPPTRLPYELWNRILRFRTRQAIENQHRPYLEEVKEYHLQFSRGFPPE